MLITQVKQDLGLVNPSLVTPSLVTPNLVDVGHLTNVGLADGVWKTVEARHFILNFLIVILWSSAIRPINREYESWFLSRARFADRLLKRLSEPGWELAEPIVEEGIAKIAPVVAQSLKGRSGNISDTIEILSHYHFKRYDRAWSSLRPVQKTFDQEWSSPSKLFFAFGPHIGIGDEMILFLAVEAFMRKFPNVSVEVWSHSRDLWKWNPKIDAHHIDSDALAPFVRAQALLEEKPDALIAFCDFLSDKIYRVLETVPGFERFFYIDIGSRLVRLVNQTEGCITEYESSDVRLTIYDALKNLLNAVGIETPKLGSLIQSVSAEDKKSRSRVFLNPHSSKEKRAVSAQWWADAVHHLSVDHPIELNIVAGINEANQQFSQSIADLLESAQVQASVLPKSGLDGIINTALSHDIIFGLDTFTAHMNTISKVNCVTVFFGTSGDNWRVPQETVLNLQITDQAILAGSLAKLLLHPVSDAVTVDTLCQIANTTESLEMALERAESCKLVSNCLDGILNLTQSLFAHNHQLAKIFTDYSMSHIESLKGVVKVVDGNERVSVLQTDILRVALMGWKNSNLSRYSRYIASQQLEEVGVQ
jgi:ADP-heptose:LPS heptosyltransferase